MLPENYKKERTLKIATVGRKTGRIHKVKVWFGVDEKGRLFLSSLPSRDWVKNVLKNPDVEITIKDKTYKMRAIKVEDEDTKNTVKTIWRKKYGMMARIMRLPRKNGIIFELKEV